MRREVWVAVRGSECRSCGKGPLMNDGTRAFCENPKCDIMLQTVAKKRILFPNGSPYKT